MRDERNHLTSTRYLCHWRTSRTCTVQNPATPSTYRAARRDLSRQVLPRSKYFTRQSMAQSRLRSETRPQNRKLRTDGLPARLFSPFTQSTWNRLEEGRGPEGSVLRDCAPYYSMRTGVYPPPFLQPRRPSIGVSCRGSVSCLRNRAERCEYECLGAEDIAPGGESRDAGAADRDDCDRTG